MDNILTIEQFLDKSASNTVYKSKGKIYSGLFILAVGVALLILPTFTTVSTLSFMPPLLLMTGIILLIVGIFKMAFRKTHYYSKSTNQKLKSFSINFDVSEKENLIRFIKSGKILNIHTLKRSESNGLRLSVFATSDLSICLSQIISYIPFDDVALTEPKEHTNEEAIYLKKLQN